MEMEGQWPQKWCTSPWKKWMQAWFQDLSLRLHPRCSEMGVKVLGGCQRENPHRVWLSAGTWQHGNGLSVLMARCPETQRMLENVNFLRSWETPKKMWGVWQTPTQSSCDLANDSPNLRWAISLDDWHKMLLLLVYQIFVHTKIIANLLFLTSCVKCFKRCGVQREVGTRPSVETNYKWLYRTLQRFANEGCMAEW